MRSAWKMVGEPITRRDGNLLCKVDTGGRKPREVLIHKDTPKDKITYFIEKTLNPYYA